MCGGGNFITQAYPTNHHEFWKKRYITAEESIDDYKEVTPAQKATIEAADAKWEEPSEEFIAECKAEGAVYNSATGYFELNGLVDITTGQMRNIMPYLVLGRAGGSITQVFMRTAIRTVTVYAEGEAATKAMDMAFYASSVETIAFKTLRNSAMATQSITQPFRACAYLHTIYGVINVGATASGLINLAPLATNLKYIQIKSLKTSITFADCPRLSLDSIAFMVDNAANTAPITITLHPDAYARLTDELIEKASARQITFATTQ